MIILVLSFLLSLGATFACQFKQEIRNVYSLSGPVTMALRDLNLIKSSKLKGISVFHPIKKGDFNGQFLPGGVFLSHETLKKISGSLLFYDESRELKKILSQYKDINSIEIKTRYLTPPDVLASIVEFLTPLLSGCDFSQLKKQMSLKLSELKKITNKKPTYLFFLGPIHNQRLPEMLMVQDGIVKWMSDLKLIQTYPSDLAYVNWSAKIMNELPRETYRVGLKDSGSEMIQRIEKRGYDINLSFPGALIPGIGQVDAMIYLFKNL
jgi:hypothetical protein